MDQVTYLSIAPGDFDGWLPPCSLSYPSHVAMDFRKWLGGEEAINAYCHKLALDGGKRLAQILGTKTLDETGEFTLNMVGPISPSSAPIPLTSFYRPMYDFRSPQRPRTASTTRQRWPQKSSRCSYGRRSSTETSRPPPSCMQARGGRAVVPRSGTRRVLRCSVYSLPDAVPYSCLTSSTWGKPSRRSVRISSRSSRRAASSLSFRTRA